MNLSRIWLVFVLLGMAQGHAESDRENDTIQATTPVAPHTLTNNHQQQTPTEADSNPDNYLNANLDYETAIADLEDEHGPYASGLPQHLMSLGIRYQHQGQYDEASEVFKRAMHVSRISAGLYSLNQVPIIEHLIENNVASGDWASVSESHQYLYWLHQRNFGKEDPRMLPVITKLSNWHLNAYALDVSGGLLQHLINAHNLYTMAVNIIEGNFGRSDMRLISALRGLTVSNYYLATYSASSARRSNFDSYSNKKKADEKARLEQYILNSYASGKRAINRIQSVYATNPEAPAEASIQAKIELADWNLLFNRRHSAMEIYQQVYDVLAQSPETQSKTKDYFGRPVALPNLPLFKGNLDSTNDANGYVLVSFDVTRHGRARNIEILESFPEGDMRNRSRVRKVLKMAKFRPRFADGAPIITEKLKHRYVFAD